MAPPDEQLCRILYMTIKASLRSHSRRPSSSEVCHVAIHVGLRLLVYVLSSRF